MQRSAPRHKVCLVMCGVFSGASCTASGCMSCCGCSATGSLSLKHFSRVSFPLQRNHCIYQMPPLDSSALLVNSPTFVPSWSQSWFFFCSLGMDLFKWRRPASHPVLSTAPTLQLKFFSLTHSITPDTIDLTYWCVGAWLFRGIWPQLIEQAFRWWSGLSLQPKRASVQLKPSW